MITRPTIARPTWSLALFCSLSPLAQAQWSATSLHPPGAYWTYARGVSAAHQFGTWDANSTTSYPKPVIWSGGTSFVNLAPGATDGGELLGGTDETQFGDFRGRAAIWHGTPERRVDLDPSGTLISQVLGASGQEQVGHRAQAT